MRVLKQFRLLLWKNFLIQKRKVLVTLVEIGVPTFFALLLILIRQIVVAREVTQPTKWDPFEVEEFCPHVQWPEWTVYYTPDGPNETRIMHNVIQQMEDKSVRVGKVVGFPNESALVDKFMRNYNTFSSVLGGVVFTNLTSQSDLSRDVHYKIRLPYTPRWASKGFSMKTMGADASWKTQFMFPLYQTIGPRNDNITYGDNPGYYQEGLLTLQYHIDRAVLAAVARGAADTTRTALRRAPYPPYNDDLYVLVLQNQFPFIIMLSLVFCSLQIVKDVVHEKERRLKETMKMMGLVGWLHWLAWFTKYVLLLSVSVAVMTGLFCVDVGRYGSVLGYTHWSVLLVFLMLYAVATINFSFMVSVFFSKANSGAAAGGILFFMSYVPYTFLQRRYSVLSQTTKVLSCLLSNVAMSLGAQVIGMFEGTGAGVQWSTLAQPVSVDDDFSMLWVMVMLAVDAVLYALVAWYVETVWPGEYGLPLPWYFPVMRSYWCGGAPAPDDPERRPLLASAGSSASLAGEFIESEPQGLRAGIQIRGLTKVFKDKGKENIAVDHMTLNMYEGQITALLGHNGAGKTTTMAMLTGFFPASSGSALVNGYDIRTEMAGVRRSLGLCPQHNVLFDSLTVQEHLQFFAQLKGCPAAEVDCEVDEILSTFGLEPKRHVRTVALSGGMKRKLSVGIALIGGSKVVILDEPTSGMDPNARRQTWDILQRYRGDRTLVLTTHYMDEADVLGDRIAIMAAGGIQCAGTPLYLKNKYGAGYHLILVKSASCDVRAVSSLISSHVPTARLETNVSAELSYCLPQDAKPSFVGLLDELETRGADLGIASYGVSVTTMEEVFLRAGEVGTSSTHPQRDSPTPSYGSINRQKVMLEHAMKNSGLTLYLQQYYGMFVKRVLHTYRNVLVTATQLFVPLLFTILALIVIKTLPKHEDSPPLILNTTAFDDTNYVPYSNGTTAATNSIATKYKEQFEGSNSKVKFVNTAETSMEDYLVFMGERSISTYTAKYLIGLDLNETSDGVHATAYFDGQAFHTAPMTLNALDNALLRYHTNDSYKITTVNHPFPRTVENKVNGQLTQQFEGFIVATNVVFGMAFLTSSFILFLIKERSSKAKHCQFVSGVHSVTFWGATFTWDLINYLVPCILLIVTFAGFGIEAYTGGGRFLEVLLLFLLYGWAVLPMMYLFSFLFTVPASGFVWISMLNIVTGIATVLAVNILRIPGLDTENVADILDWVFLALLPNFCLGQGLGDFYNNHQFLKLCGNEIVQMYCKTTNVTNPCCKDHCGDECADYNDNYLSLSPGGIGRHLVFLSLQGALYFCMLLLGQSQLWQSLRYRLLATPPPPASQLEAGVVEDSDVAAERRRITAGDVAAIAGTESIVLDGVTKYYGGLLAVDSLTLGIPRGECFGLLGINGAGKTTTFRMMTGDEGMSAGRAYINGYSVTTEIDKVRHQIGYCPQFDALIDQMTGREVLRMYARLRGIPGDRTEGVITALIARLLLEKHADKLVQTYSGGTKRKLSVAVALIGDPPVVFLDEPSTGMDPAARRHLWDTLGEVRDGGSTLVLTSHSMEECEALCTRISIMVNGHNKCLGSIQQLKNKFGEGFTLIIKVSSRSPTSPADTRRVMSHVAATFPGSILKDVHQGMLHYHMADTSVRWSELFSAMEAAKARFSEIEDYSLSQTTLDQVFVNFARAQRAPQETRSGCCGGRGGGCGCCSLACLCCCRGPETVLIDEDDCDNVI